MSCPRRFAACAALLAVLPLAGCGKSFLNVGKLIADISQDSIAVDLFLIGDAGLPAPGGEPVLQALKSAASRSPGNTLVVFLGDNLYPTGLPDTAGVERREAERILDAQIDAVRESGSRGIMVPGNHDWEAGGPGGLAAVMRQAQYVAARGQEAVRVLPVNGCPGPEVLDFGEALRLIVLDTQWWLHEFERPVRDSSPCATKTEAQVVDSIRSALRNAATRSTVVVAHHPLVSGGQHGGYFDWPSYLFPLHPWVRQAGFFAQQDVTGERYRRMIQYLTVAFREHPPLLYAAGHEHNLQVLRRNPARYMVVSGGGVYGHTTAVRAITGSQYVRRASGFMRLSILQDGRARLAVIVVDGKGNYAENFSMWLEPTAGAPAQRAQTRPATP
ncbi:MAG TPA: metallophosphoesterase [Longimicrobiaceae bacterium]|nr:metallophosphoesterase [Longimicrobiaceae bacterium]